MLPSIEKVFVVSGLLCVIYTYEMSFQLNGIFSNNLVLSMREGKAFMKLKRQIIIFNIWRKISLALLQDWSQVFLSEAR